jgi:hypothetical protein
MQVFLKDKAKDNSAWKVIVSNNSIFIIAHELASRSSNPEKPVLITSKSLKEILPSEVDKISGVENFKAFLVHLFVLSILWVHFKHADEWSEGHDVGNERLNMDEFKMACRTFCSAQANESLTEAKIAADFKLLDTDESGSIEFTEVRIFSVSIVYH